MPQAGACAAWRALPWWKFVTEHLLIARRPPMGRELRRQRLTAELLGQL
jgi:hypothetical protein